MVLRLHVLLTLPLLCEAHDAPNATAGKSQALRGPAANGNGSGFPAFQSGPVTSQGWNFECGRKCQSEGFSSSLCEASSMQPNHRYCNCYERLHFLTHLCTTAACRPLCRSTCSQAGYLFGALLQTAQSSNPDCFCYTGWKPLGVMCD
mmetsp:Transcript_24356/g.46062  ORF Transcript_24356/g.46062 Transcript_24356/m.46062 type:complete len:148 (-) Transcript_24356:151-594(-)